MNAENLAVLTNIIGGVESGGQVYGKRRYDAYDNPYKNSAKEHTITIGWYQAYGHEAKQLMTAIYEADPSGFEKLDTCRPSIASMLTKDWVNLKWNPSASQKEVIIKLIDTPVGHKTQDKIFADKMVKLIADCERDYTSDVKAQMMYCEIRHLGGKSPCDRIFKRCNGDYSLDRIMTALVQDQRDATSDNQVGDTKYWSRHVKCRQFIDEHYIDEVKTMKCYAKAVLDIAEQQVGYKEKRSGDLKYLYDKTANAGNGNFTKFNFEMHKFPGMDYPAAWCDAFCDWCFYKAYGEDNAKRLLCGGFDDYTPNSAQKYKNKNRWGSEPKVGAQIFFKNSIRICHTGLVYKVSDKYVYTIEGNCDNEVKKRSYLRTNSKIAGYGYPLYDEESSADDKTALVKEGQRQLNNYLAEDIKAKKYDALIVDGDFGKKTLKNFVRAFQTAMNESNNAGLVVDGIYGYKSKAAARNYPVRRGQKSYPVTVLEIGMLLRGIDPNGVEYPGIYGSGLAEAAEEYFGHTEVKELEWTKLFTI